MKRNKSPDSSATSKWIQHASMDQLRSEIAQNKYPQNRELVQLQDDQAKMLIQRLKDYRVRFNNSLKKEKRKRIQFTIPQLLALKTEFELNQYISRERRFQLSRETHLDERTIKIWFQNQRLKYRRELIEADDIERQRILTQYPTLMRDYAEFEPSSKRLLRQS